MTYGEEAHVGQEDVDLNDLGQRRVGSLEDSLEVLDALGSLVLDRALDESASLVRGDLARAEDGKGGLDGLGLLGRGKESLSVVHS